MLKTLVMALLLFSQGMTLASTPQWLENDLNDARELLLKSKVRAEMTSTEDSEFTTYLHLDAAKKKLSKIAEYENRRIINKIKRGETLSGSDLTTMHQIVANFLELQYSLSDLSKSHNELISLICILDKFEVLDSSYTDYYSLRKFRRLINDADSSFDIQAQEISRKIIFILSRENIFNTINKFNNFADKSSKYSSAIDLDLKERIKKHPAVKLLRNYKKLIKLGYKFKNKEKLDKVFDLGIEVTHLLSKAFGNGTGAIRWRKGHLFKDDKLNQEILDQLKPLDIITEKTYFALTDTFIPGHFGHNAIWLGTKKQIMELGMWYHPSIIPFHDLIEEGLSIIETDRTGTHLKSLKDFMNVDEFAILRVKDEYLTHNRIEEVYSVALSQIGKTYDFNFDVETTDQLVCSELLYQSFGDIKWPTQKWPGRMAISPDDVTSIALYENSPVDLVYYIAEKKKGEFKYKNLDHLAKDLGYEKIDSQYYKVEEKCQREYTGRKFSVPGSRIKRKEYVNRCYKLHHELKYVL